MAGLSVNKENYRVLVGSVKNPGKTVNHLPGVGHGGASGMTHALRQSPFHPCIVSAHTLRKKNGAFVPSPICAFTFSNREQAGPAAQPSHQPRADPSGGPTLSAAADLRAVPTSPTPAEESDVSSAVTDQGEASGGKLRQLDAEGVLSDFPQSHRSTISHTALTT